jgi:hypothetical protein
MLLVLGGPFEKIEKEGKKGSAQLPLMTRMKKTERNKKPSLLAEDVYVDRGYKWPLSKLLIVIEHPHFRRLSTIPPCALTHTHTGQKHRQYETR